MHIHIISPSGHIEQAVINAAISFLLKKGLEVTIGNHVCEKEGRFAGTDDNRIEDIKEALLDDSIDVLLCSRGGYGLQRIIPAIQPLVHKCFYKNKRLPLLVGFSDITILHQLWGLYQQTSVHAPMCKTLSEISTSPYSKLATNWFNAIEKKSITYTIPPHKLNKKGSVKSYILGGNISVLHALQATPLSLNAIIQQGKDHFNSFPILFIEDVGEQHYHIERMMLNFKYSGVFNQISGLIIGKFAQCPNDPAMKRSLYQTIADITKDYSFPTCFNFPAGHVKKNLALSFHKQCEFIVKEDKVTLSF